MILKVLSVFVFTCSHLILMGVAERSPRMDENVNHEIYRYLDEKKIRFTGNSAQYVKFDVKLSSILDFAMCLWYRPEVILDNNILFSYGSKDQQLILWKIKKKQEKPVIILKILSFKIMEEKLETLTAGQWHHLCQYWHGSTGLWSLFLNAYIVSFGYTNTTNSTDWYLNGERMSATINQPDSKRTLHGEIYGFHLMSTDFGSAFRSTDRPNSLAATVQPELTRHKRQAETIDPDLPDGRTPFFRVRNFLKFIRRMISLVTVPIFRFTRRLIQPWTRRFVPLRPTIPSQTPKPSTTTPAAETTTVRSSVGNATAQNGTGTKNTATANATVGGNATAVHKNRTESTNTTQPPISASKSVPFNTFEESIVIYESEFEAADERQSRGAINVVAEAATLPDSGSVESSVSAEPKTLVDKCAFIASKMDSSMGGRKANENFVTTTSEKPSSDAITHLGSQLLFVQFLFACCPFEGNMVLISWAETKAALNNVVVDAIEECGHF